MLVRQFESKVSNAVSHRMPEVKNPVRPAAEKTGTVNHVRLPLYQGIQQAGIIRRIVLEIRILNHDKVSGSFLNATPKSCALSHIFRLQKNPQIGVLILQLIQNFAGAVTRPVIYTNEFHLQWDRKHALNDRPQGSRSL